MKCLYNYKPHNVKDQPLNNQLMASIVKVIKMLESTWTYMHDLWNKKNFTPALIAK